MSEDIRADFVRALAQQQKNINDYVKRVSDYYEEQLKNKQAQIDSLILTMVNEGGATNE